MKVDTGMRFYDKRGLVHPETVVESQVAELVVLFLSDISDKEK